MSGTSTLPQPRAIAPGRDTGPIAFTIGTLVNDAAQYEAMRASFAAGGFAGSDCEYLMIDNTGSYQTDAYAGLNAVLDQARGRLVILCHQDVRLMADGRAELERRLAELDAKDPSWALAGNAGGVAPGEYALRISDPHAKDQRHGPFPARVTTLDENFIVVRREARVGFSRDLHGFHFYGADICLAAAALGHSAYVVDFHLSHLSAGRKGPEFRLSEAAFRSKWSRALRPRWLQTTCSLIRLSGTRTGGIAGRIAERPFASLIRRVKRHPLTARDPGCGEDGGAPAPLAQTPAGKSC
jgi:hypothetical protein